MIGSIIGDIAGSVYEFTYNLDKNVEIFESPHSNSHTFTDDSVMSIAIADCILYNLEPSEILQAYGRKYPGRGYGGGFSEWLELKNPKPYHSYGNGAAMRINPVGFLKESLDRKLQISDYYTGITHNHPEGLKGARCIVDSMHKLLFEGYTKEDLKKHIEYLYEYDLNKTVTDYRLSGMMDKCDWNETCQGTIPQVFACFFDSNSFEDSIRNSISIGGDADTIACIVGGLSECYYKKIPNEFVDWAKSKLDGNLLEVVDKFEDKYGRFY